MTQQSSRRTFLKAMPATILTARLIAGSPIKSSPLLAEGLREIVARQGAVVVVPEISTFDHFVLRPRGSTETGHRCQELTVGLVEGQLQLEFLSEGHAVRDKAITCGFSSPMPTALAGLTRQTVACDSATKAIEHAKELFMAIAYKHGAGSVRPPAVLDEQFLDLAENFAHCCDLSNLSSPFSRLLASSSDVGMEVMDHAGRGFRLRMWSLASTNPHPAKIEAILKRRRWPISPDGGWVGEGLTAREVVKMVTDFKGEMVKR